MLGEQLDDEELQDIFNEYDPELTGRMDFLAFIALMKGWKKKVRGKNGDGGEEEGKIGDEENKRGMKGKS